MTLKKGDILSLRPPEETVEIPGGKVLMHGLSAVEHGEYEVTLYMRDRDGKYKPKPISSNYKAALVSRCLTDEDGASFSVEEIASLDAGVVSKLYDVACRLCGIGDKDIKEMAEVFKSAQDEGDSSKSL